MDWQGRPGATPADIAALVAASEAVLPDDYLSFLRFSNGGQGEISVQPLWLMLYDTALGVNLQSYPNLIKNHPGHFITGSNSSGESIAFDFRPK